MDVCLALGCCLQVVRDNIYNKDKKRKLDSGFLFGKGRKSEHAGDNSLIHCKDLSLILV